MTFKIDLHVHSRFSGDSFSDPEDIIDRAIERSLHGIAFTEHYSYEASEPVESLKEKYADKILLIRGVEFSSAEGHCLIFGMNTDRKLPKYAPVDEVIRIVNAAGGVVIPSHPYRGGNSMSGKIQYLEGICAIEGYNGCNLHAFNSMAVKTAKRLNIPFTGGSDAHLLTEVGACFTEFEDKVTQENFIELLKRGNYFGTDARKISRMSLSNIFNPKNAFI